MSRGPHPEDTQTFSPRAIETLRLAAEEVSWLLGRGYSPTTAVSAAGNHHQLELRQRVALSRGCCSDAALAARIARRRRAVEAAGQRLQVDGFNLVIALEVALSGGVLIRGREGALRDLAGLRGTYHLIPETAQSVTLVEAFLTRAGAGGMDILLDRNVSNAGRLRALILEQAVGWELPASVELVPDPDPILAERRWVVSADALIVDRCGEWVNLASEIVAAHVPQAWVVDLE